MRETTRRIDCIVCAGGLELEVCWQKIRLKYLKGPLCVWEGKLYVVVEPTARGSPGKRGEEEPAFENSKSGEITTVADRRVCPVTVLSFQLPG